jgi:mannose-6-phosphate isomerase-like protein (cupin superfamily)
MKKVVITAFDITTAKRAGQASLSVPENALVTPQAADDARDYGIALVRGASSSVLPVPVPEQAVPGRSASPIAAEVRRRILARLGGAVPSSLDAVIKDVLAGTGAAYAQNTGDVVFVSAATASLRQAPSSTGAVAMVEAAPPGLSAPGVAYMAWENSSFSWTFPQAEVLVVLEGEMTVTAKGETRTGKAGDTFIIPAGTEATLSASGGARCVHSSWPNPETAKG